LDVSSDLISDLRKFEQGGAARVSNEQTCTQSVKPRNDVLACLAPSRGREQRRSKPCAQL
jgi:hypothetical protein